MDPTLAQILTELYRVTTERDDLLRRLAAIERHIESLKPAKEVTDELDPSS